MTAPMGNRITEVITAPPPCHDRQPPADFASCPDCPSLSERITVALIPKVREELQRLQDQTSLSKTDIVNRAITLYRFIEAQRSAGQDLLLRDKNTGEIQVILMV
jgi:hypothetical protein